MKTSNYIIIALAVFITGCTLVLFITNKNKEDCHSEIYPLDDFSVVVAEPGACFQLQEAKGKSTIELCTREKKEKTAFLYKVDNDTLFLSPGSTGLDITVSCSGFSLLKAKNNSHVSMENFHAKNLLIEADKSNISMKNMEISCLEILADSTIVFLYPQSNIDSLSMTLRNKAQFYCYSYSYSNASQKQINCINNISIHKDQSSHYEASSH